MKNPTCGACINDVTFFGSLKSLSFSNIVCPFCNHKNKLHTKYIAIYFCLGLMTGVSLNYSLDSGAVIPLISSLILTSIILIKTWSRCFLKVT